MIRFTSAHYLNFNINYVETNGFNYIGNRPLEICFNLCLCEEYVYIHLNGSFTSNAALDKAVL